MGNGLLLVIYTIAQLWHNFLCDGLRMVQFPLHPLGTRAEGVQLNCSTIVQGVQWKLCHPQAIAMEIAP